MTDSSCSIPALTATPSAEKPLFGTASLNGQALSIFRILFAGLLFYDFFWNVLPIWDILYSAQGTLPAQNRNTGLIYSLFTYSDNIVFRYALISLYVTSIFGFLVGYKTRFCAFMAFILFASIVDRNYAANSNAEILIRALLLWSCFLPLDRHWSVAAGLRGDDQNRNGRWPIVPVLAIKAQLVIIYLFAGIFKLGDGKSDWISGDAIKYAVSDNIFGTQLGRNLFEPLPHEVSLIASWGVVIFQLCFSFLVYSPWRNDLIRALVLLAAVAMHISFILFLEVGIFPMLCLTYLFLLVPDRWIDAAFKKRRERLLRIRIFYDPDCGFCLRVASVLREFCLPSSTPVRPASDDASALALLRAHNSWVVYGADGKTYMKWNAVAYVLKQSPLFWIFGAVTGSKILSAPMEKLYDAIGRKRHGLGTRFRFILSPTQEQWPSVFSQVFCLFCLVVTIVYSVMTLPALDVKIPNKISTAAAQLGVIQTWNLFAPYVSRWRWDILIIAHDDEGNEVDLSPLLSKHFKKDEDGYYKFDSHRVLKYYSRTFEKNQDGNRKGLARYICNEMAERGTPVRRVAMRHLKTRNYDYKTVYKPLHSLYICNEITGRK